MKSTRQDVVVLVLTILVSFSLIKEIVLLTSTVANADVNDPFAQNLTIVKQGRESLDPIPTDQLNLKSFVKSYVTILEHGRKFHSQK
jgi:hypothetical protein